MGTFFVGSNYTFNVFAYEGFSYTISNPDSNVYTLQVVSNSGGFGPSPSSLYFTKNGNDSYTFSISDASNNLTAGTTESFILQATGPTTLVSSNNVIIGAGRFLDGSGNSLSNTSYTFFKNERITPIRFVAPSFTLKTPLLSIPALPPGLSFVSNASNIYDLSGIPLVTVPTSNYQIIGVQSGGSKIVTTRINMSVSNERVLVTISGSPIISNMQIGTPISPRVLTAIPPDGSSNVRYSYPQLPNGIVVTDINGVVQSGTSFSPSDPSFTMIVQGTPTSNAAYTFRTAGVSSNGAVYPIQVSRIVPTPVVDSSTALTFAFGETVLFDLSTAPPLYVGIPVDSSAVFFKAGTFFTSNVGLSTIFSPDLDLGLSLEFIPSLSRANLKGTPTTASSATYTLRAINSNGTTRDYSTPFIVSNDSVTFESPVGVDLCYNFILSRPVTLAKSGYYPSPIQFVATAASGRPVTLSAPVLTGTGLSLSANGTITGTPTSILPLTDLVVTANVSGSPATATKTVKAAILDDVFTFTDIPASSLNFFQNVPSTPFQVQATTLSERGVIGYSQIGLPTGLTISPAGFVSGTPTASSPTSGTATILATTGFATGSRNYTYSLTPDAMIFFTPQTSYTYNGGDPISPIDIDGLTFSGLTVSNYDLSISNPYGMTINSTTGVLSGTWETGIPPGDLFPRSSNFAVTATAGGLTGTLPAQLIGVSVIRDTMLVSRGFGSGTSASLVSIDRDDLTTAYAVPTPATTDGYGDIRIKTDDATNNLILATGPRDDGAIYRGTNLGTIQSNAQSFVPHSFVNKPGTSTWWAGGAFDNETSQTALFTSTDDALTWGPQVIIQNQFNQSVRTRNSNGLRTSYTTPYASSFTLAYSSNGGVLLVGGIGGVSDQVMLRSLNEGQTWSNVTGGFSKECGGMSLDVSTIWIATGSDLYETTDSGLVYSAATDTIKYSLNQGASWINAVGTFNMFGYDVAYGSNTWIASGMSYDTMTSEYKPELRFSTNGSTWTQFDLSTGQLVAPVSSAPDMVAPLPIGPIVFDGDAWYIFVNQLGAKTVIYRHDTSTSLTSGWVPFDISGLPTSNTSSRIYSATPTRFLYTSNPPIQLRLTFPGTTGPTFTSPATQSYLQYQYATITPIQLSATGTGTIYFFVTAAELPPGLTFNPRTNQITGKIVQIGTFTTQVYAKDDNGVSVITLTFTTIIPRIIRKQDGAGAYTSLLRQYTEVLGAQNARDSRVFPTQESKLGEFMSPEAPDVITQKVDPKCFSTSNCP